jgi:hypothetical protein
MTRERPSGGAEETMPECDACLDTGMEYGAANSNGDDFFKACDTCGLGRIIRYAANGCLEMTEESYDPVIFEKSACGTTLEDNIFKAIAQWKKFHKSSSWPLRSRK